MPPPPEPIPLLLLKSPTPTPALDTYTTAFPSPPFTPHYIPTLIHTLTPDSLIKLFLNHLPSLPPPPQPPSHPPSSTTTPQPPQPPSSNPKPFPYGAILLTSQRAVSAVSTALAAPPLRFHVPALQKIRLRLYTVGPATAEAARGVVRERLGAVGEGVWEVCGGEGVGDGGKLGGLILGSGGGGGGYDGWEGAWEEEGESGDADDDEEDGDAGGGGGGGGDAARGALRESGTGERRQSPQNKNKKKKKKKKPVLFLTGEKRRDILPQMLQDPPISPQEASTSPLSIPTLKQRKRIQVDEMKVYSTSVLEEFSFSLQQVLRRTETAQVRFVVLFSLQPAKGVLEGLGWLDGGTGRVRGGGLEEGGERGESGGRGTFLACIGPTTAGGLREEFGVEADVVAGAPSARGLREGVERYLRGRVWLGEEGGREGEGRRDVGGPGDVG